MSRVVGSYGTEMEAVEVIEDLQRQGYRDEDISVLSKDKKDVERVTEETGTQASEGAAAGAATGGALGGLGGVLAGLGALAIPGIGPIVAAGPIAAGLTGAVAGAGVGGIAGALIGLGVPEDEAKSYEEQFKEGRILVLVEEDKTKQSEPSDVNRLKEGEDPLIGTQGSTNIRGDTEPGRNQL
ncbi:general stress protein [Planococcus maritimus]|uniref:General stress protein n=1 Tax=Planococcus maritimus TaxID=192421 RepID=A0A7D7MI57_PLAMR|nr:general stress protein [Planococcus maritimus]KYG58196.1 general stress protein [Planococcus maritimus]QMT18591.1 general stress protein [Planococcus maritimus]